MKSAATIVPDVWICDFTHNQWVIRWPHWTRRQLGIAAKIVLGVFLAFIFVVEHSKADIIHLDDVIIDGGACV